MDKEKRQTNKKNARVNTTAHQKNPRRKAVTNDASLLADYDTQEDPNLSNLLETCAKTYLRLNPPSFPRTDHGNIIDTSHRLSGLDSIKQVQLLIHHPHRLVPP